MRKGRRGRESAGFLGEGKGVAFTKKPAALSLPKKTGPMDEGGMNVAKRASSQQPKRPVQQREVWNLGK
uniref:Uncharacterized protein n=1 Tax=Oryza punctata TaxID=4537 RepID=A0A0E0M874_ORYPU